jgi:hypothetical protein
MTHRATIRSLNASPTFARLSAMTTGACFANDSPRARTSLGGRGKFRERLFKIDRYRRFVIPGAA